MIEFLGIQWGTAFQLLTTLFSGGLFAAVLAFIVNNRRINVDAADKLRAHFMNELDRLAKRQQECEKREEALRNRVREVEDQLEGVYRTLVATSAEKVIELGIDAFPMHVIELAERTLRAQGRRKPRTLEQSNGSH